MWQWMGFFCLFTKQGCCFQLHSLLFCQKLFSTRNIQMDAKSFYFILKSTFEVFGSSFRKEKILSMQLYEDLMLYTNWKVLCYLHLEKKNFVHIAHHEGLKYCVTAKPSGIQSTELSFVWHPGSSLLQMETQAPFNFTNIFFIIYCVLQILFCLSHSRIL